MTRFADPARSRAVLIGTSVHPEGSGLPALPAVRGNLADLRAVLTDPATGVLPLEHCITVADPRTASDVGSVLGRMAQEATDLLLVYYGGHGLVDDRGRLHLALPRTEAAQPRWNSLPFETLREELLDSPAAIRVLILDCCFSGRAIEAMTSQAGTISGQIDITGTYTLASTSATAVSYAPLGATHTAFTGALLAALRRPEPVSLDQLFGELRRDLELRGFPRPQRRVVNNAGDLALVRPPAPKAPDRTPALPEPAAAWPDPGAAAPVHPAPRPPRPERPPLMHGVSTGALVLFQLIAGVLSLYLPLTLAPRAEAMGFLLEDQHWARDAFLLAFAAVLPLAGRVGDARGRRGTFLVGGLLFAGAVLLGALASHVPLLLTAQALQGAAAALGTVNAMALVVGRFRRPLALGLMGATAAAIPCTAQLLTWATRWSGATPNAVTLAILAAFLTLVGWLRAERSDRARKPATASGTEGTAAGSGRQGWAAAAVSLWGTVLVYGQSRIAGDLADPLGWLLVSVACAGAVGWAIVTRTRRGPGAPYGLLSQRRFAGALVGMVGVVGGLSGTYEYFSVPGHNAWLAQLSAVPVTALLSGLFAPSLRERFGDRLVATAGALALAAGLFVLPRTEDVGAWMTVGSLVLAGAGGGLALAVLMISAFADRPVGESGTGATLLGAGLWVVGSVFFAVAGATIRSAYDQGLREAQSYSWDVRQALMAGGTRVMTTGAVLSLLTVAAAAIALRREGHVQARRRQG